MIKPKEQPLKLKSSNLERAVLKNNILSIQLSLDGFSFCIYDDTTEVLIALEHYPFKVQTPEALLKQVDLICKDSDLLKLDFKKISICHENNLSALVPKSLFDKEKLATYLSYTIKTLENDYFDYDDLDIIEAANVYIPYVNLNNYFIDKYGSFTFNHSSSLLIKPLLAETKNTETPQMFVHIGDTHFEIIVIQAQKLELYNSFTYQTKEDFIYYILFVAEQLKLNTNTFELFLLGKISPQDTLFAIAYNYVKNVKLYTYNLGYKTSFTLTDKQKRQFFTLLQQI